MKWKFSFTVERDIIATPQSCWFMMAIFKLTKQSRNNLRLETEAVTWSSAFRAISNLLSRVTQLKITPSGSVTLRQLCLLASWWLANRKRSHQKVVRKVLISVKNKSQATTDQPKGAFMKEMANPRGVHGSARDTESPIEGPFEFRCWPCRK